MPSMSWPSVILGAALLGGVLGAVQPDAAAPRPEPTAAPAEAAAAPAPSPSTPSPPPSPSPIPDPPVDPPAGPAADPQPAGPGPQASDDRVRTRLPAAPSAQVALTFDDGPHPEWTPLVLDELARHGVPATFCLVGEQVAGSEDLVRRIHAEGHRLCNHTESHDYALPAREPAEITAQIEAATSRFREIVPDAEVTAFRAPGGRFSPAVVDVAAAQGLDAWGWSIDPRDWSSTDPEQIVSDVLDSVEPGAVVLLHDGGGDRSATVRALTELIPLLQSVGYEFVTLP